MDYTDELEFYEQFITDSVVKYNEETNNDNKLQYLDRIKELAYFLYITMLENEILRIETKKRNHPCEYCECCDKVFSTKRMKIHLESQEHWIHNHRYVYSNPRLQIIGLKNLGYKKFYKFYEIDRYTIHYNDKEICHYFQYHKYMLS